MHEVQLRAGESTNLSVSPSSTLNNSLFLSSACIPPLRPFFLLFHHNKNPQFFILTPSSFFTFSSISLIYIHTLHCKVQCKKIKGIGGLSSIQWLKWPSPFHLIVFFCGHICSTPKVEAKRTCRCFNQRLHLQTQEMKDRTYVLSSERRPFHQRSERDNGTCIWIKCHTSSFLN